MRESAPPGLFSIPVCVTLMILTGASNTLLSKYQDKQCVYRCDDPDPARRRLFEQPVLQTAQMFAGEMGCWLVVAAGALYRRIQSERARRKGYEAVDTDNDDEPAARSSVDSEDEHLSGSELTGFRVLLLALPAICDILGTTLMNIGLLLVTASVYQMTRGALVLFVGLFSVVFLKRKLLLFHWLSLFGVVLGVAVVGLAGALSAGQSKPSPAGVQGHLLAAYDAYSTDAGLVVLGVMLIAGAQMFTATQFVLEEWILGNCNMDAIRVVGWEGTFGFAITVNAMLILHAWIGRTEAGAHGPFDAVGGLKQMLGSPKMAVSSVLIMVSIAGFNFFGLNVTRSVSATARSTIDTSRTLLIWLVSLQLGWETFQWLQVAGFGLLVYFTFLFNGIVKPPFKCLRPAEEARRDA